MNIIIHRGAKQIGGCITEISTANCKILIDFGANLPGSQKEELTDDQILNIVGNADAVFYTHYHGDHVGLYHRIPAFIKQYIGMGAKEVMQCLYETLNKHERKFEKHIEAAKNLQTYTVNESVNVGNKNEIFVTPYFVSHSAFDAYMFKIECEGKTILHTGDFRKHGYFGKGLFPTLEKYIGNVDILITEGTMLGRMQENVVTESVIQQTISKILKKHKYVFALCSSTDMDRLAGFHAACKNTGRVFWIDEYQKRILDIFSKYAGQKTPLYDFTNVFDLISFSSDNVKQKIIREGFLMPVRTGSYKLIKAMLDVYNDEEAWLIYSMWGGYAEENQDYTNENVIKIRNLFEGHIFDGTKDAVHTSGHADVQTLADVCLAVNPRIGVIPIHKEENTKYELLPELSKYTIFHDGMTTIDNIFISLQ